ncbi:MAG: heme exporter protein CcmB [Alphaproteobacteria bacterium]|jgi:heme exporter protein B|nr:heme exporter protein CcmB [Alphaproteobacteria bacterium]
MVSLSHHIRQELSHAPQSVAHVLLVFLSLIVAFGVLSSNHPALWEAFLPTLLMGVSYGIVSLSLGQLFREDWEDGTLEWWVSEKKPLEIYVLVKIVAHWLRLGIPLTGIVGVITGLTSLSLLIGVALTTLALTLLGAIGSALCLNAKANAALLLPLLTLPLGIPMMLVSMAAITDPTGNLSSYFTLQGGLFLMACAPSLMACPFALRLALR